MRPTFAFTLIAASIAVTSAEPFIGKGHLTFSTYDNSGAGVFYHKVGCLQSTGQLTVDTSQCAIFNGSQIVIPNSLGYPPLIYGNLTAGNNVCGVDSNDSYYYIKCGPGVDALSAYWGVSLLFITIYLIECCWVKDKRNCANETLVYILYRT